MGQHVRKPLDDYMSRLADSWQISQPLHLRHLSIVRDTILKGKTQIYIYYTYENFNKLVEGGTGFWEAVTPVPREVKIGKNVAAALDAEPDVDEYGFPRLDENQFQGCQNDATLEECVSALKVDPLHISAIDPVLRKLADGNYGKQHYHESRFDSNNCDLGIRYRSHQQRSVATRPVSSPKKVVSTPSQTVPIKARETKSQKSSLTTPSSDVSTKTKAIEPEKVAVSKSPCLVPAKERTVGFQAQRRKHVKKTDSKALGRPRKYPKTGIPANFNTMTPDEVETLFRSQEMFEKYELVKVDNEITRRIEDGEDAVAVAYEVLAERDNSRKQEGELPLPNTSRARVLNKFAGKPMPEMDPSEAKPKGRPRIDTRYRPSMAAHTYFVPALRKQASRKPKGKDPENGPPILPTQTRRRGQRVSDLESMIYFPSVAAHSWPYIPPPSSATEISTTDALQNNDKRKQGRIAKPKQLLVPRFKYLPSIAAHSGPFPDTLPVASVGQKRKRTKNIPSESDEEHTKPAWYKYLPSIAAHSGSYLPQDASHVVGAGQKRKRTAHIPSQHEEHLGTPSTPSAATPKSLTIHVRGPSLGPLNTQPNAGNEGLYTGWEKFMSKYYQRQLETIIRSNAGVFFGKTKTRRKRPHEPRDFRPGHFKLAVFKSLQLSKFDWFVKETIVSKDVSRPQSITQTPTSQVADPMPYTESISQGQPDAPTSTSLPSTATSYTGSQPISTYLSPYVDTAGTKRKRTTSPQPTRGATSADPFSASAHRRHSSPTMESSNPISKPSTLPEIAALSPVIDQVHGNPVIEDEVPAPMSEKQPDTKESNELTPNTPVLSESKTAQSEVATSQVVQASQPSTQMASKPLNRQSVSKISRRGGSAAMLRKTIVMDIIDRCEGVFPSHKEMTSPFAAEWKRRGQEGTPEAKTISNAVDALVKENKLRQITFASQTRQGITVTKSMLILPTIDPTDSKVKETQASMMAYHPRHFVPMAVLPPQEFQSTDTRDNSVDGEETSSKTTDETITNSSGRLDVAKKTMDGKDRAASVWLKALDQTDQQGLGHADGDEPATGPFIQQATTNTVHSNAAPSREILPKSTSKRSGGRRGQKRVERLTSVKKTVPPQTTPSQTIPANLICNPGSLIWLPSKYAFSDSNFEKQRPTILMAAAENDVQISTPEIPIPLDSSGQARQRIRKMAENAARIERKQALTNSISPSLLHIDVNPGHLERPYGPPSTAGSNTQKSYFEHCWTKDSIFLAHSTTQSSNCQLHGSRPLPAPCHRHILGLLLWASTSPEDLYASRYDFRPVCCKSQGRTTISFKS